MDLRRRLLDPAATGLIALSQIKKEGQSGPGLAIAGTVLGAVGILGALLLIVLAAVDEGIDEFGYSLDRAANVPVGVHVAAGPRVCYSATLITGSTFSERGSGFGQSSPEACGSSSFPVETGLGRSILGPHSSSQPSASASAARPSGSSCRQASAPVEAGAIGGHRQPRFTVNQLRR